MHAAPASQVAILLQSCSGQDTAPHAQPAPHAAMPAASSMRLCTSCYGSRMSVQCQKLAWWEPEQGGAPHLRLVHGVLAQLVPHQRLDVLHQVHVILQPRTCRRYQQPRLATGLRLVNSMVCTLTPHRAAARLDKTGSMLIQVMQRGHAQQCMALLCAANRVAAHRQGCSCACCKLVQLAGTTILSVACSSRE